MNEDTTAYNNSQDSDKKEMCELLEIEIRRGLPNAESKVWHGAPVWFIDGNPIVGYTALKDSVQLLFWSGQSFHTPGLVPEGKFKAADARYKSRSDLHIPSIETWLKESQTIQWDYKNIVKRRGILERLK